MDFPNKLKLNDMNVRDISNTLPIPKCSVTVLLLLNIFFQEFLNMSAAEKKALQDLNGGAR